MCGSLIRFDSVILTHLDSINVGGQLFTLEQPESMDPITGQSTVTPTKVGHYNVLNRIIGRSVV